MLLLSSTDFFQKFFQEHYQSVKRFEPDQDQHSVGPDMGPYCLQRLSADDKSHGQHGKA